MMKIAVIGAAGRMGSKVVEAAEAAGDVEVVARIDTADGFDREWPPETQAAIDFSHHGAAPRHAALAAAARIPYIVGSTGLDAAEQAAVEEAARSIPVVQSANFSLGVNVLAQLVEEAARILGGEYDIEIVEMHHRRKRDAPSGTALMLSRAAAQGRSAAGCAPLRPVFGRHGETGERPGDEIGVHAVRGGGVFGDHTAVFAGEHERIELVHRAQDRAVFAAGALRAARWALAAKPGLYSMRDVLARG